MGNKTQQTAFAISVSHTPCGGSYKGEHQHSLATGSGCSDFFTASYLSSNQEKERSSEMFEGHSILGKGLGPTRPNLVLVSASLLLLRIPPQFKDANHVS